MTATQREPSSYVLNSVMCSLWSGFRAVHSSGIPKKQRTWGWTDVGWRVPYSHCWLACALLQNCV